MEVDDIEVSATKTAESTKVHTPQEEAAIENSGRDGVGSEEAEEFEDRYYHLTYRRS